MDWTQWRPQERATLCFIIKSGHILLIRKKRGLGAGKVNAPGGKIEPGETTLAAAIRETQEEVGVTPLQIAQRGTLQFQFTSGYSLHCTVFRAEDYVGDLVETDEALPFWVPLEAIPFSEMWEDDRHWLPEMLAGRIFEGRFIFDHDEMLTKELTFPLENA